MHSLLLSAVFGVVVLASFSSRATEDLPSREFPEGAQISTAMQSAPGRERTQSVDGNPHTVVAPLFEHMRGTISYIRFKNNDASTATHTVTIVGSPSGHVYGVVPLSIPAHASKQFAYSEILSRASVPLRGYIGKDAGFSFYLQADMGGQTYQHVIHNADTGFFENMTVCRPPGPSEKPRIIGSLNNVHTTNALMTKYPSAIVLHHYGAEPARYVARIYRSEDGAFLFGFSFPMDPNDSYGAPAEWYQLNWMPRETESHINIEFMRADGGPFEAIPAHAIYNAKLDAFVNMTEFCPVAVKPAPAAP